MFFHRERPRRPANYCSCFSIPIGSILELLGSRSKSTVLHHSSVQWHHSSVLFFTLRKHNSSPFISTVLHHLSALFCTIRQLQFCTLRQFSSVPFDSNRSVPFISSVLHHLLATILRHLFMIFYNSPSTNNLATNANTLCRLFNCIS